MKNKRLPNMLSILFMLASFILVVGCDKDYENNIAPITLSYEDNVMFDNDSRHYHISPFIEATTPLYIKGGDGHYTVSNLNKEIITVDYDGKTIQFKPVALGSGTINIKDNSGNQYDLIVEVRYNQQNYIIASKDCIVKGDNITIGEKKELENKVKSSSNVELYEFTYTDKENTKGTARLYQQKNSSDYKEYDFENKTINTTITVNGQNIRVLACVTMKTGNETLIFYVTTIFSITKSVGGDINQARYCFVQDLTEQYKADYPAMEKVYEIQLAYWKRK